MGFLEIVTLIFLVMKLLDKLDWSWWWVFAPMWIGYPAGMLLVLCIVPAFYWIARKFQI